MKCEDLCVAYDHTPRTTQRKCWTTKQTGWPGQLMSASALAMGSWMEQLWRQGWKQCISPTAWVSSHQADLATAATENQIWVPRADQKGIVVSLVYKSPLILDKVVIHVHWDWQVLWLWICLFCPRDLGQYTIPGLRRCLIHWHGIAPISLGSRLLMAHDHGIADSTPYHTIQKLPTWSNNGKGFQQRGWITGLNVTPCVSKALIQDAGDLLD